MKEHEESPNSEPGNEFQNDESTMDNRNGEFIDVHFDPSSVCPAFVEKAQQTGRELAKEAVLVIVRDKAAAKKSGFGVFVEDEKNRCVTALLSTLACPRHLFKAIEQIPEDELAEFAILKKRMNHLVPLTQASSLQDLLELAETPDEKYLVGQIFVWGGSDVKPGTPEFSELHTDVRFALGVLRAVKRISSQSFELLSAGTMCQVFHFKDMLLDRSSV